MLQIYGYCLSLVAFFKKKKNIYIPNFTFSESLELPGEAKTAARQK